MADCSHLSLALVISPLHCYTGQVMGFLLLSSPYMALEQSF